MFIGSDKKTVKPRLLLLADGKRYILSNCYQQQLYKKLKRYFKVDFIAAKQIGRGDPIAKGRYDYVLSVLKLRTLDRLLEPLTAYLHGTRLYLYEQDPWEGFIDTSPFKGTFERVCSSLNVASFLNTSLWWSRFLSDRGIPSKFVRMGMLPELCEVGRSWEQREIAIGFQGTLHPHRKKFFDQLADYGIMVSFLPSSPYKGFLKNLQNMRIYIHTEDAPWQVDGELIPRNALWIKDTEAAARGCFSIRDHECECLAYGVDELPTIFTYRRVEDVPRILQSIDEMSNGEKNRRMLEAVDTMRRRDDWMTVIEAMRES